MNVKKGTCVLLIYLLIFTILRLVKKTLEKGKKSVKRTPL